MHQTLRLLFVSSGLLLNLAACCNNTGIAVDNTSGVSAASTTGAAASTGSTTGGTTGSTAATSSSSGTTGAACDGVGQACRNCCPGLVCDTGLCGEPPTTSTGSSGTTSGTTAGETTSSSSTSSGSGSTSSGAIGNLRVADFVTGIGLPFDLCLSPHGTAFTSSSLGVLQGSTLQVSGGLSYGQVSAYTAVAPGSYDVVIMNGGEQSGCSLGYPTTGGPLTVPATGLTTFTLYGSLSSSLSVAAFLDDPGNPLPASPELRVISVVDGIPSVEFGTGFGATFDAVAINLAPGDVAPLPGSDANGYALLPAGIQGMVATRETDGPTLFAGQGFALASGGYGTLFLSGHDKQGQLASMAAEVCDDSAGPQPNDTFQCVPFQPKALLRLVNLVVDTGALDLCVTNPDAGTAQVAPLAGVAAGIGYAQSSAYVPVPANYDENQKTDLALIAGGGSCPGTALVDLSGQYLAAGTFNTLAAEGAFDGGPYAPVALLLPVDEEFAPPDVVSDGGANVRFQTGATYFGPALGGTGTPGNQFNGIMYSVFGQPPTGVTGSALNDGQGYTILIPTLVDADFAAYDQGDQANVVSMTGYDVPMSGFVSSASSIFVIGAGLPPERPWAFLQIDDQAVPVGGLLPTHP